MKPLGGDSGKTKARRNDRGCLSSLGQNPEILMKAARETKKDRPLKCTADGPRESNFVIAHEQILELTQNGSVADCDQLTKGVALLDDCVCIVGNGSKCNVLADEADSTVSHEEVSSTGVEAAV